jgi:Xaa-Pro aminopeptidase
MATRREILSGSIAGSMAGFSGTAIAADASLAAHHKAATIVRSGPLMNLARAYDVMAEEGLDGLVMAHPTNVYHLTGYYDHVSIRHDSPASYVLLARNPDKPPAIVMSQFLYYYSFADNLLNTRLEPFLFTGWDARITDAQASSYTVEPKASAPFVFADMGATAPPPYEKNRLDRLASALVAHPASASAEWALLKAARALGLDRGRIGYDHAVVAGGYQATGMKAATVYAENTIRRIRMIKSPREVELMRLTSQINADAALAAVRSARAGATRAELRALFFAEAAKRGNAGLFMQIDTVVTELNDGPIRDGDVFAIDCVSLGHRYFGDYGRTICVGEPGRTMKRAMDAISFAWDAVRENLKPGVKYSDIPRIGREALKKQGYDFDVAFTPHSVGLAHSDEPGRGGSSDFWAKDDITLQENMIISVDLPVRQSGIGGSAHLEDLTLITRDGAVQINDIGDRTVMI